MGSMIDTNDLRRGNYIVLDGILMEVLEQQHHKPGKGGAMVRTKLRNLKTGSTVDKTLNAGIKVPQADLEEVAVQYMFRESSNFVFMNMNTYEQISLSSDHLGDRVKFLKEEMRIDLLMHEGEPVGIELPFTVTLKVTDTPPGIKGDTASGGSKPATVETGASVNVPFFINIGDSIVVDTRTGAYVERA